MKSTINPTINYTKKELIKSINSVELATKNASLIESKKIDNYLSEKTKSTSTIETYYTPLEKTTRIWNGKTEEKIVFPKHLNHRSNTWENGIGGSTWMPYQNKLFSEATNKWCLIHEGEKSADFALSKGIVSTCLVGAKAKDYNFIAQAIELMKLVSMKGAIYLADEDEAGLSKAKFFQEVAYQENFLVLILPVNFFYPEAKRNDDFADFVINNPNLSTEEIINNIEDKIKKFGSALATDYLSCKPIEKSEEEKQAEVLETAKDILLNESNEIKQFLRLEKLRKTTKFSESQWENKILKALKKETRGDRLKLDLKYYDQEEDVIKKLELKQKICGRYYLSSRDFEDINYNLASKESEPDKKVFSFDEFMGLGVAKQSWIVPSFLPEASMLLLCAAAKNGKSLMASDLAYSIITGGTFLNQQAKKGKVLYVCSDELPRDFIRRLQSRGFDLIPNINDNLRVITHLDLYNLKELEKQLEDFRPDCTIIDSLTSISLSANISENSADYAKQAYKLKDLLGKYGSASVLIHHQNKNVDAQGLNKVSGSARITAVPWGIAQLSGGNSDIEESNIRYLELQPREGEPAKYQLSINPRDSWIEDGIFKFDCDFDDPNGKKKSLGEQILAFLDDEQPKEYSEINEYMNLGKGLYKILDYLCERRLINRQRSKNNPKRWTYSIDTHSQVKNETGGGGKKNSPPPLVKLKNSIKSQSKSITEDNTANNEENGQSENYQDFMTNNLTLTSASCCENSDINDNEEERKDILEMINDSVEHLNDGREKIKIFSQGKMLSTLTNKELMAILEMIWEEMEKDE